LPARHRAGVRAGPRFRDGQLDGAGPRVPLPRPVAVARAGPRTGLRSPYNASVSAKSLMRSDGFSLIWRFRQVRWRTHITLGQLQPNGRPDPSLGESTAPKLRTDVGGRRPQPRNRHGEAQLITFALTERTTAIAVKSHHPRFVSGTYDHVERRDRPHPPDTGTGHGRIGHDDRIAPLSGQLDPVAAKPQPSRARAGEQQRKYGEENSVDSYKNGTVCDGEVAWPAGGCRERQRHGQPPDYTDCSPREAHRGRRDHVTPRRPPKHHITRQGG